MKKEHLKQVCSDLLIDKISSLKEALYEVQEGANDDTKSTAGDKHETSRAMAQIEVERLSQQLELQLQQFTLLQSLPTGRSTEIERGAYIKTDKGDFYLGVGLGSVNYDGIKVMTLGMNAPLSILLIEKKINDTVSLNGNQYHILGIF
ncbi:MAG: hypothetical protein H6598_02900 [Flavobacteriales bacterium]|nr:hypothetical protein [Flavobacteriales bacterium]